MITHVPKDRSEEEDEQKPVRTAALSFVSCFVGGQMPQTSALEFGTASNVTTSYVSSREPKTETRISNVDQILADTFGNTVTEQTPKGGFRGPGIAAFIITGAIFGLFNLIILVVSAILLCLSKRVFQEEISTTQGVRRYFKVLLWDKYDTRDWVFKRS